MRPPPVPQSQSPHFRSLAQSWPPRQAPGPTQSRVSPGLQLDTGPPSPGRVEVETPVVEPHASANTTTSTALSRTLPAIPFPTLRTSSDDNTFVISWTPSRADSWPRQDWGSRFESHGGVVESCDRPLGPWGRCLGGFEGEGTHRNESKPSSRGEPLGDFVARPGRAAPILRGGGADRIPAAHGLRTRAYPVAGRDHLLASTRGRLCDAGLRGALRLVLH